MDLDYDKLLPSINGYLVLNGYLKYGLAEFYSHVTERRFGEACEALEPVSR